MTIKERFLQLCDVQSTTGKALENLVMKLLEENQLKVEDNLVDKLYTFIANSTKRHAAFVETQKAINPDQRPLELQKISDTRWTCRENALKTIRKVLPAAMQYLEDLRKCEPPDLAAGDAKILLRSINFQFLLCLEITTPVFLETSMAYNALQQKDLDLAAAYTVIDGVLRRGQVLRTDEKFTEIFMKAEALDIEIPEQIPGQGRCWKVPEKFKYSSTSANEDHHVLTLEEYYRGKLYFTFLYILRQELERRFRASHLRSSPPWIFCPVLQPLRHCWIPLPPPSISWGLPGQSSLAVPG
ncbi:hypothetical protein KUCAC02_016470 [Chaenocephalus aceratus]|nr:hypothetical protein KUCAC02_016470 [Chaenocephalus aceratus]